LSKEVSHHLLPFPLCERAKASNRRFLVTIKTFEGRVIISDRAVRPVLDKAGSLILTLPARLFDQGEYTLILQGVRDSGASVDIDEYHFRIRRG
jgi:hypothetical protein